jgi:hypothetical protein
MAAIRKDLGGGDEPLFLGHTWIFSGRISDGSGAPQDLTGCTFVWVLKHSQRGVDLVRKIIGDGIALGDQTVDATKGTFTITVNPADTDGIEWGASFYYQADVTIGTVRDAVMWGSIKPQPVGIEP